MRVTRADVRTLRREPKTAGDRFRRRRVERRLLASAQQQRRVPRRVRFRVADSRVVTAGGVPAPHVERLVREPNALRASGSSEAEIDVVSESELVDLRLRQEVEALNLRAQAAPEKRPNVGRISSAISASATGEIHKLSALSTDWQVPTAFERELERLAHRAQADTSAESRQKSERSRGGSSTRRRAKHGRPAPTKSRSAPNASRESLLSTIQRASQQLARVESDMR